MSESHDTPLSLDPIQPETPTGVIRPAERRRDELTQRLGRLKSDDAEVAAAQSSRLTISFVIVGVVAALIFFSFFVATVWRLHGPQATLLKDGWARVIDREWGFEIELPDWHYSKNSRGAGKPHYQVNFPSYALMDVYVSTWRPLNAKQTSLTELSKIVSKHRSQGSVEILIDRSGDPANRFVEFSATNKLNHLQTRRRVMIHGDTLLEIVITGSDHTLEAELKRALDSVRWLH